MTWRNILKFFFHLVSVIIFCAVAIYGLIVYQRVLRVGRDGNEIDADLYTAMKFMPAYATNWNFIFQSIFLISSLVHDVTEWLGKNESRLVQKLKFYQDVMFAGVVVPMTLFVVVMFWTLFLIDRELVFPKSYDQLVPKWYNHCIHTNIGIVVLLETLLVARRHPANQMLELTFTAVVGTVYAIVYYSIYFFANRWLYGVFGIMTWWQVCLFQLLVSGSSFVFYFIQFPINRLFHKEVKEENTMPEMKNGEMESGISMCTFGVQ